MLAVDPVTRITVPDILQHPFFTSELPRYLTPLPPPPGPVLGTLSALVHPPNLDFEIIEGLGRIEEDIIDDLAARMDGIDKEDIWECLRRDDGPQGNAVKVAYMLLRDKRRLGRDRTHHRTWRGTRFTYNHFSGRVRRTRARCSVGCYGRTCLTNCVEIFVHRSPASKPYLSQCCGTKRWRPRRQSF